MKVKPISRSMKATALTNPNPSFVSQVKAGANGKAWRAVKMDAAVPVEETPTEDTMKLKPTQKSAGNAVVAAVAPKGYGVMQFDFAKSEFADEAAVTAWMDAGGYTDYTIAATKSGFAIENDETKFLTGSVSKIEGFAKGVAAFVGKLADPTVADEEQPEGDAAETATKAAAAIEAAQSPVVEPAPRTRAEGETVPVLGAGHIEQPVVPVADITDAPVIDPVAATPADAPVVEEPVVTVPGVTDVQPVAEPAPAAGEQVDVEKMDRAKRTAELALKTALDQNPRTKGVYEASSLGSIVNQLAWIVYDADYTGISADTVTKINTAALALLDAFMQAATDAAEELAECFGVPEAETDTATRSAAPAPVATETQPDIAALVATAVREAIAPIEARAIAAETAATAAREETATAQRALTERVEADNARGQTRKGAEDPVVQESTIKTAKDRSGTSTNILRSFGSRHA